MGVVLPFDLKGAEFAMTALFLVIFVKQWDREATHESSLVGIGMTTLALVVFGKTNFLIPAMLGILAYLTVRHSALHDKLTNKVAK